MWSPQCHLVVSDPQNLAMEFFHWDWQLWHWKIVCHVSYQWRNQGDMPDSQNSWSCLEVFLEDTGTLNQGKFLRTLSEMANHGQMVNFDISKDDMSSCTGVEKSPNLHKIAHKPFPGKLACNSTIEKVDNKKK